MHDGELAERGLGPGCEREVGEASGETGEGRADFHSGQLGTDAAVQAVAECEVGGAVAAKREPLRVLDGARVAVSCREGHQDHVTFVDLFTPTKKLMDGASVPLTINGIHLSEAGDRIVAGLLMQGLGFHPAGGAGEWQRDLP